MILNIDNPKDSIYFNMLQKARGVKLIKKYLPHLYVHKQFYVVNTVEEWEQIKDNFQGMVTVRTDNRLGCPIPKTQGITRKKEYVSEYIKRIIEVEKNPSFLCMKLEEGTAERVDTLGGVVIDATIGGQVYIDYIGPCFDCREITKGIGAMQSFCVPWDKLLLFKESNILLKKINEQEYRDIAIKRMEFLIREYPERRYEIIQKMPNKFKGISPKIMDDVAKQVLEPLYMKKRELLQDGLNKFDVELNISKNGRIIPMEICRPERFLTKKLKEEKDEAR